LGKQALGNIKITGKKEIPYEKWDFDFVDVQGYIIKYKI
jgi:hypothetical protein